MKKNLIFILSLGLFLLFPFISVKAATKINFQETSNGNISTSLHFEEGFVGGIELKLNLSDMVQVKNFTFNQNFIDNNFTRYYNYDAKTHILTVRVTAGGVGASHNLLDKNKELFLGVINISTTSKQNVDYVFSSPSLSYIDISWKNQPITQNNLTLGEKTKFTYVVNTSNPPVEPEKDPEPSKDPADTKPDDKEETTKPEPETKPETETKPNTDSTGNNTSTDKDATTSNNNNTGSSNNKTENKTPTAPNTTNDKNEADPDKDKDESSSKDEEPNDQLDDTTSTGTSTDKNEDSLSKDEKSTNKVIIIIAVVAIVLVILVVVMAYLKSREKKTLDF